MIWLVMKLDLLDEAADGKGEHAGYEAAHRDEAGGELVMKLAHLEEAGDENGEQAGNEAKSPGGSGR